MILTLIRHAEVQKEYQAKYNGHLDIGLSQKGFQDAKALKKQIAKQKFDKIYCSDLLRAKQTLQALELTSDVIYTQELREKSWGRHEGKSFDEIQSEGIIYKNFEQWIDALDGERKSSYIKRIQTYFFQTIATSDAKNVLVVTHSGVIKTLLALVKGISLEEAFSLNIPYGHLLQIEL
jgi:broad specificity phosphatase PhoE